MDKRIIIQSCTETQDSHGQLIKSWATAATVWAAFAPVRGTESFLNAQKFSQIDARFTVRYMTGITTKHRINHDGVYYDIVGVLELGRKKGLDLLVKRAF